MCGIFGWVGKTKEDRPDLKRLERLAVETETRGRHAFGLAWLGTDGQVETLRMYGRITEYLSLLTLVADSPIVIGHCRHATHGLATDNRNNHPHTCGRGAFVHNGTIPEYKIHYLTIGRQARTECDSEVLGHLITFRHRRRTRLERVGWAIDKVAPGRPLAFAGLWPEAGGRIVLARRNGQPLHAGGSRGGTYVASLAAGLTGQVQAMPADTALSYDLATGACDRLPLRVSRTVALRGRALWTGSA